MVTFLGIRVQTADRANVRIDAVRRRNAFKRQTTLNILRWCVTPLFSAGEFQDGRMLAFLDGEKK